MRVGQYTRNGIWNGRVNVDVDVDVDVDVGEDPCRGDHVNLSESQSDTSRSFSRSLSLPSQNPLSFSERPRRATVEQVDGVSVNRGWIFVFFGNMHTYGNCIQPPYGFINESTADHESRS